MPEERRQHPRVPVNRPATVRTANGESQRVKLFDLSVAGVGLLMPAAMMVGEQLDVEFYLSHEGQSLTIAARGVVCRTHIRGGEVAVGVNIQELAPEARQLIAGFIYYKLELTGQGQSGTKPESARTS